jgi:hypothetical protein
LNFCFTEFSEVRRETRELNEWVSSLPYFASNWMAALCEIAVVPLLRHISLYMFIVVVRVGVL